MNTQLRGPTRLPSEEVIVSAPMSYSGSAQRIVRLRRRAQPGWQLVAITAAIVTLIVVVWLLVTVWYLMWGFLLVPYRLVRRGQRKRKVEALRHRELMGAIEGSAAASAAAIVTATIHAQTGGRLPGPPGIELVADADRERAIEELRHHLLAGRLTTDEFEERLAAAQHARTRADLALLRSDLPR